MIRRCGIFLATGIAFGLLGFLAYRAPQIPLILFLAVAALVAAARIVGALMRGFARLPTLLLAAMIVLIVLGFGCVILQNPSYLLVVSALSLIVYGLCLSRGTA